MKKPGSRRIQRIMRTKKTCPHYIIGLRRLIRGRASGKQSDCATSATEEPREAASDCSPAGQYLDLSSRNGET
jgi:hypothetical protein